jgi:predicted AAA+ superfamily ATPase
MKLIPRNAATEVLSMANSYPVVTVLGPRQSGKTTLVKSLFPDKPYISLEDLDEQAFIENDPRAFLEKYPDGIVLDEIQRQPQLLSYIQGIVDKTSAKGKYILTGSHQLALHQAISQSLAGRTAILKLLPLSIHELSQVTATKSLDHYIYHGMYPRIHHDNINPTKYYRDYTQTYIERDVRQLVNIKDLSLFQKFLKLCAGRVGQLLNSSHLSNEVGVSNHTVENWLSILEASFVIFRLQPYFENLGKRITKSTKLYFVDVGLATYLLDIYSEAQVSRDPLRGGLAENLVITEAIKNTLNNGFEPSCYFYRDSNNNEVDLLFKIGNHLIPIEIKSSQTFNTQFLSGLQYFKKIAGERCTQGYLIYAGEQEQKIDIFQLMNFTHVSKIIAAIYQE